MPDDQLTLRKTTFGDGETYPDDWQVFWRGLPLKQPGIAYGKPDWFWSITFQYIKERRLDRGVAANLDECKVRFKATWADWRARLTEGDIARERRHLAEGEKRPSGREPNELKGIKS
jgi:hypothetical protein